MFNALNYTDGNAVCKDQTNVKEDLMLFHRSYFQNTLTTVVVVVG